MAKNKTPFRAGRTLDALYENVEILTGQRGGDYKAVTSKEVSALKGTVSTIIRGGITGGSGSGSEEIIERPHAPVNVQGFGGFSSVLLSWDNPTFQGYAHAEVWRSASRNLSQAALIGTTPATVFSDVVDLGTGYYYWVRFVNKNDVAGAYHDVAGIYVETSPDIGGIIDDLANQLVSSDLFQALQSDIDTNRTDLDQAEAELNSSIDAAKDALTAAIARVETERKTADATMSASITELEQVVSDGEGSLVQQVAQIRSDFESADEQISADITEAKKVLTDVDSAIAERVNAVEADFKTGDSQLVSLLKELERVTASVSEVIAMAVRQLNVAYQTVSTGEKLVVDAKITETQKVIANAEQALAQQITELEASFQTADATINATITELAQTVSTEDQALSERIDTTSATINGVSATVSSHNQAIANIDSNGSAAYRAMWTQKASAGQVTAGIGLLAGSGGVSQVVVSASQFFVFNPNSPTTKTPLFAIDAGKVIIPEALIEKATIQILNAQTITADYVRSGISITSPVINSATINAAKIRGSSDAGFGSGGPYSGYNTFIYSSGALRTNNIVAIGGTFSNVTIDDTCTVENVVLKGQTITPKVISTPVNKSLTATYGTIATASLTLPFRDSRTRAFVSWNFTLSAVSLGAASNLYVRVLINGAVVKTITHKALFIGSTTYACGDSGTCISNYYAFPAQIIGTYGFTPTADSNTVQIQVMQVGGITINAENITLTLEGGQSA